MIKYHLTAFALRGFSCCASARHMYRDLGNVLGARRRRIGKMPLYYYERVERNLAVLRKYAPLQAEDLIVELGTGWVHWEALTLRLFFDFRAVLYDVWDNRQLTATKSYVRQLVERFGQRDFLKGSDFERARSLARQIERAESFDEIYEMLGFRYVLDPGGLMEGLPQGAFRLAISAGVMEHIPAATAPIFVSNMASLLKPGGLGIHSINITDHLYLYDRSVSPKQYLTYSESLWRLLYENRVQYINRIQRGAWLKMFASAGFNLVEETGAYADLSALRLHSNYHGLSQKDIDCTTLDLVVEKI
jgi:hypothetical protein